MQIGKYSYTTSPDYRAPEIHKCTNPKLDPKHKEFDPELNVNIEKAISYTCGIMIDKILKMGKGKSDEPFFDELQQIMSEMTNESPE